MTQDRKRLGKDGETRAADFLKRRGFTIVETNFCTRFAEIDIIALEGKKGLVPKLFRGRAKATLCFIEVKTRSSRTKGRPAEAVTAAKQQEIILAAQAYLKAHPDLTHPLRFDVVEVTRDGGNWQIHHIPHAFQCQ